MAAPKLAQLLVPALMFAGLAKAAFLQAWAEGRRIKGEFRLDDLEKPDGEKETRPGSRTRRDIRGSAPP